MYAQFNLMYQSHAVWGTYVIVHVYIYMWTRHVHQIMYIYSAIKLTMLYCPLPKINYQKYTLENKNHICIDLELYFHNIGKMCLHQFFHNYIMLKNSCNKEKIIIRCFGWTCGIWWYTLIFSFVLISAISSVPAPPPSLPMFDLLSI